MVAEIDGDTLEQRQTVYLKHIPVVHLIGNDVFAVHTDNLGTPKLLTSSEGETVWQATYTPLGEALISQQAIEFNLRFPGQYADAETGTHYNYQRDYDPRTGRYLTSDPIGLAGGDNTYAYANNNVLGAIDALGLSSTLTDLFQEEALPFSPIGPGSDSSTELPTTSPVPIPTTLTPDVTNLGITDINQLVTEFLVSGSLCESETGLNNFNEGVANYQNLYPNRLLVGGFTDLVIEGIRQSDRIHTPANEALAVAIESVDVFDDSALILIPHCASDVAITDLVRGALGKLVHQSEINEMIASMGEPGADGCRQAKIIDVSDLLEEVLTRFETKLALNPRVRAAEEVLMVAQNALDVFLQLHNGNPCDLRQPPGLSALCRQFVGLQFDVREASETLGQVLEQVYEEQVADGLLPAHLVADAEFETRKNILLGVVGLIVPLTLTDAALDATLFGLGKVKRLFQGAGRLFGDMVGAGRRGISSFVEAGSDAFRRANAAEKQRFAEFPGLNGVNYLYLLRADVLYGGRDTLAKLSDDIAANPNLGSQMANNPTYMEAWKYWDDLGETTARQRFEEIRTAGQYNRPPVTDYLSPSYMLIIKHSLMTVRPDLSERIHSTHVVLALVQTGLNLY